MNYRLFFILCFLLLFSCNNDQHNTVPSDSSKINTYQTENSNLSDFRKFISKFQVLSLPLTISLPQLQNLDNLPLLYGNDTLFLNTQYKDTSLDKVFAYGLLPDTSQSFNVICLVPAENYVPYLVTFSKNGKKINEDYLGVGQCGSDCCYTCTEIIKINSDLSIYSADSIRSCQCDSLGPQESKMKRNVLFKTAKISNDGKFSFSKVVDKKE
ncbi:MAG: hypothetical protein ACRCSM_06370 [Sediminibacterium sp.]|nr:hypothetical protein [Chitinophagaceae bacterium]MCA6446604.1 hypothetical protein [Chitinophagaceae bacterium]